MLQAMNTGHEGSMTTVHANNARDATRRVENMVEICVSTGMGLDMAWNAVAEETRRVRQMLVVSTNLDPDSVMEPAILRRIGYRLRLDNPEPDDYAKIFSLYAQRYGLEVDGDIVHGLIKRHANEDRPMRGCVPRDLIERVRDICTYRGHPFRVDNETIDLAWRGYFGHSTEEELGQDWS